MMSALLGGIRPRQEVGRGLSEHRDKTTPVYHAVAPCPLCARMGSVDTGTDLCVADLFVVDHLAQTMDDLIQQLFPD